MSETDRLKVILGPMGSGKSTELQREIAIRTLYQNVLAVNTVEDTRYSNSGIVTHDGAITPCIRIERLSDLREREDYKNADVVAIDEGNFYQDIERFIKLELKNTTKIFIVAGLMGDKNQGFFGDLYKLLPLADDIQFVRAICLKCKNGTLASFTIAKSETAQQKQVGGAETYMSVCRKHLH